MIVFGQDRERAAWLCKPLYKPLYKPRKQLLLLFVFEQVWLPVSIGIFAFVPVRHQALVALPRNKLFPNELLLANACQSLSARLAGCCKLSGKSDLASAWEEILSIESKLPKVVDIRTHTEKFCAARFLCRTCSCMQCCLLPFFDTYQRKFRGRNFRVTDF